MNELPDGVIWFALFATYLIPVVVTFVRSLRYRIPMAVLAIVLVPVTALAFSFGWAVIIWVACMMYAVWPKKDAA